MKRNVGESKREYRQAGLTAIPGICRSFLPGVAVIVQKKKIRSKFGQNGGKHLPSPASPMSPQPAGVPDANMIRGVVTAEVTATASQI